ncbi:RNA polymerase sigma factor FliA [Zymobacter sp. IVIA_12111.31 C1]|uniref:RNA polymerase sigma factor FliA n=1 Tax=Zymobacter sp. IVIA_12111.31 C1 TaxID=3394854 RepID=UPI0039C2052C
MSSISCTLPRHPRSSTVASDAPTRTYWRQKMTLVRCIAYALQARLHLPATIEIDDLIQAGAVGLLDARQRYDPLQGASFDTYAAQRIRGSMLDALRERDWLPRSVRHDMRQIEREQQRLEQRLGRAAKGVEVASSLRMPSVTYHQLRDDVQNGQLLSYEGEGIEEEGAAYHCDSRCLSDSPERLYQRENVRTALGHAIDELPERLRIVLEGYYFQQMTLRQLGERLGVSESRICQLRRRTERFLHRRLLEEGHMAADIRDHMAYQDASR